MHDHLINRSTRPMKLPLHPPPPHLLTLSTLLNLLTAAGWETSSRRNIPLDKMTQVGSVLRLVSRPSNLCKVLNKLLPLLFLRLKGSIPVIIIPPPPFPRAVILLRWTIVNAVPVSLKRTLSLSVATPRRPPLPQVTLKQLSRNTRSRQLR